MSELGIRGCMRLESGKRNNFSGYYKHCYRLNYSNNVDPSKSYMNREIIPLEGKTFEEVMDARLESLGFDLTGKDETKKKVRANAITYLDVVCALPEKRKDIDIDSWINDCLAWCRKEFNQDPDKYGDNVMGCILHMDESSPHIHVVIQPIDAKGALNGSRYKGNKFDYEARQDRYWEEVSKKYEIPHHRRLSRGTHREAKEFLSEIKENIEESQFEPLPEETIEEYSNRSNELRKKLILQYTQEKERLKSDVLDERSRANIAERNAKRLQRNNEKLKGEKEYLQKLIDRQNIQLEEMETLRRESQILEDLNTGLKKHPDHDKCTLACTLMNELTNYGKQKRLELERTVADQ